MEAAQCLQHAMGICCRGHPDCGCVSVRRMQVVSSGGGGGSARGMRGRRSAQQLSGGPLQLSISEAPIQVKTCTMQIRKPSETHIGLHVEQSAAPSMFLEGLGSVPVAEGEQAAPSCCTQNNSQAGFLSISRRGSSMDVERYILVIEGLHVSHQRSALRSLQSWMRGHMGGRGTLLSSSWHSARRK